MSTFAATSFPPGPIVVLHPLTGEVWDVAPLLHLVQELAQGRPGLLAESIYDTNRYLTVVQHGPADTAARLRAVLRLNEAVALAFDSVRVLPIPKN